MRIIAALAAGTTFAVMGVTGASASGAGGQRAQTPGRLAAGGSHASIAPGTRLWASRYDSHPSHSDIAGAVAVTPDGKTIVVTGSSLGATSQDDYATVAYRTATGGQLWAKRYNGPGNGLDNSNAVAISPDGKTVFVTGFATGATSDGDYTTIAYRVATGRLLWIKRYNGPRNGFDGADSVAVSPDGKSVFVTGIADQASTGGSYATIGYDAVTGSQLWASFYQGPGGSSDAVAVAVSPRGKKVFVTGSSNGGSTADDYATIAYDTATGSQLWADRYDGPAHGGDNAHALAVSPHGGMVFVTGGSNGGTTKDDYATIAYHG
jgi:WD40 repeat protein